MTRTSKLKQEENRKKSEVLKNWFSSLFMTVGVVIVVVAFVPARPIATVEKLTVFPSEVIYQLQIEDPDAAIIEGTLEVECTNQMESHRFPADLGRQTGIVSGLTENTFYEFIVYADVGFGAAELYRTSFRTSQGFAAAISTIDIVDEPSDYEIIYSFSTMVYDPYDEYTAYYLDVYSFDPFYQYDQRLQRIDILEGSQTSSLSQPLYHNMSIRLELIGVNEFGELLLDTYSFVTKTEVFASFYVSQVATDAIYFSVYSESTLITDLELTVYLYQGSRRIDSFVVPPSTHEFEQMSESALYSFKNLVQDSDYRLVLWAKYTDPTTLETIETEVSSIETKTLKPYSVSITYTEDDLNYYVTITGSDPAMQFDQVFYYTYHDNFGVLEFMNYNAINVTREGDSFLATFTISKPVIEHYVIEIYIGSVDQYEINTLVETIKP